MSESAPKRPDYLIQIAEDEFNVTWRYLESVLPPGMERQLALRSVLTLWDQYKRSAEFIRDHLEGRV